MACKIEVELIKFYKTNNREFGYNISNGGECAWLGLHHSEESRKKMSISKSNMSNETREKLRKSMIGRFSGNKNPMFGKSGVDSPVSRKIICLDNLTIYDSIADAGRKLNINSTHICAVCRHKQNKTGGYKFMYLEDYKK